MDHVYNLLETSHEHIMNLSLSMVLGLLGAFVNALTIKNFANGFQVGRIILSVCFVSPTVYILLAGFVDPKLQIGLTILSGAFHEEAFTLLQQRFKKSSQMIDDGRNNKVGEGSEVDKGEVDKDEHK